MVTCALCGKPRMYPRDSQSVPKFVIRYLKDTSVGKIRTLPRHPIGQLKMAKSMNCSAPNVKNYSVRERSISQILCSIHIKGIKSHLLTMMRDYSIS